MKAVYRIISVIILLVMLTVSASAYGQPGISLNYSAGSTRFDFYLLADFSEQNKPSLTDTFLQYKDSLPFIDSLNELTANQSRILAYTAVSIVIRDGITPMYTQQSDSNGGLSIPGIEKGVYLVIGQQSNDGKYVYTPSPLIVSVPCYDIYGNLQHNVNIIHNKVEKEEISDMPVDYKVVKQWKDSGTEKYRPEYIEVSLFKNSKYVQTVKLSAENNWCYQWTALSNGDYWTAVEKVVPSKYIMSIEKEQTCFYITNTYSEPPPPPKLPPTGQLWWPVPLLIVIGILSIALAFAKREEV